MENNLHGIASMRSVKRNLDPKTFSKRYHRNDEKNSGLTKEKKSVLH